MWVFARISTNFAHLLRFQAIEFVDQPVLKTLNIFVSQTSENKAFFNTKSSILFTATRKEREHDLISSLVSVLSARST